MNPGTAADILSLARDVLTKEIAALNTLRGELGEAFVDAVELLESKKGRVIVTGVGKSGLVGKKIAATLTSTGTPAVFLHPTEALHGDLGLVGSQDVVLALSKSGRSAELLYMIPHARRMGAAVVAVVTQKDCPLAGDADVVLTLGNVEEACSLDLVPTSSSTATMALGDALAVVLFKRRGLTEEDFAFVHPAGLIGKKLTRRVHELMHCGDALPRVPASATLRDALVEIVSKGLGLTTVVDGAGGLAGILTDGDLKRILLAQDNGNPLPEPVERFMTRRPATIGPQALIAQAVRLMEDHHPSPISSLVVVESGSLLGILHLNDCLRLE